jgi:hypothetical protein
MKTIRDVPSKKGPYLIDDVCKSHDMKRNIILKALVEKDVVITNHKSEVCQPTLSRNRTLSLNLRESVWGANTFSHIVRKRAIARKCGLTLGVIFAIARKCVPPPTLSHKLRKSVESPRYFFDKQFICLRKWFICLFNRKY